MIPLALVTQPIPIFFIVLGIILLAPLLLNRLKIPHIIGMIVAVLSSAHTVLTCFRPTRVSKFSVR